MIPHFLSLKPAHNQNHKSCAPLPPLCNFHFQRGVGPTRAHIDQNSHTWLAWSKKGKASRRTKSTSLFHSPRGERAKRPPGRQTTPLIFPCIASRRRPSAFSRQPPMSTKSLFHFFLHHPRQSRPFPLPFPGLSSPLPSHPPLHPSSLPPPLKKPPPPPPPIWSDPLRPHTTQHRRSGGLPSLPFRPKCFFPCPRASTSTQTKLPLLPAGPLVMTADSPWPSSLARPPASFATFFLLVFFWYGSKGKGGRKVVGRRIAGPLCVLWVDSASRAFGCLLPPFTYHLRSPPHTNICSLPHGSAGIYPQPTPL